MVFDVFGELCVPALAGGFFPGIFPAPAVTFVVPVLETGIFPVLEAEPRVTFALLVLGAGFFPTLEEDLTPDFTLGILELSAGLFAEVDLEVDGRPTFLAAAGPVLEALSSGAVLGEAGRPAFLAGTAPGLDDFVSINGACTAFSEIFPFLLLMPADDFDRLVLVGEVGFLEETAFVTSAALATLVLRALG